MGIKHFTYFLRKHFKKHLNEIGVGKKFNLDIDTLLIDMNGIYHDSAQKVYGYGNYKDNKSLLVKKPKINDKSLKKHFFSDICSKIDHLLKFVNPNINLVLCVDGTAPRAKQYAQRKRRFKSAKERTSDGFDSNCISPGTEIMDHLTKYIDYFIRYKIQTDYRWSNINVVFSTEKNPGEGEHNAMSYVRKYGSEDEKFCIHGLDADLIMLTLGTMKENFVVLREDLYNKKNSYYTINSGLMKYDLIEMLKWSSKKYKFDNTLAIYDFLLLFFMAGNDFVPNIPSIEILQNGIETLIECYVDICSLHGHLIEENNGIFVFRKEPMKALLETLSYNEKYLLENKINCGKSFFKDKILYNNISLDKDDNLYKVNMNSYITEYNMKKVTNVPKVSSEYFNGLNWIINYYIKGVPDWNWYFP